MRKSMHDNFDNMEMPDEKKNELKNSIDTMDLTKYNIFTEYHLK
jgi:hypothetical protein